MYIYHFTGFVLRYNLTDESDRKTIYVYINVTLKSKISHATHIGSDWDEFD